MTESPERRALYNLISALNADWCLEVPDAPIAQAYRAARAVLLTPVSPAKRRRPGKREAIQTVARHMATMRILNTFLSMVASRNEPEAMNKALRSLLEAYSATIHELTSALRVADYFDQIRLEADAIIAQQGQRLIAEHSK